MQMPDGTRLPGPGELAIMLSPLAILIAASLLLGAGLTYTLDDPYIHLTLARNILGGHYGINAGEWSSPSSSILWPFLLALFAALPGFEHVPLVLNLTFAATSAVLLYDFLARSLGPSPLISLAVVALGLGLNIYGLVFTGMEHSLQVLLVILVAGRLCRGTLDHWFWMGVVLLPLIRYEGLAISLPLCAYAWHQGNARAAGGAAAGILVFCFGFSGFLLYLGLPALPLSVIAKGNFDGAAGVARNAFFNVIAQPVLAYCVIRLTGYLFKAGQRPEAYLLTASAALFYAFGQCGWFGRYEVFFVAFVVTLSLHWWCLAWKDDPVKGHSRWWMMLPVMLAVVAFATLPKSTLSTPQAAANIHDQQMQMGEIVKRLAAPVAVNDIGAVSFSAKHYVLDLWGLSSLEALTMRRNHQAGDWISGLMAKHGIEFAFVYDEWVSPRPSGWIRVGELILPGRRITPAADTVALYATNEWAAARLRAVLGSYKESSLLARSITYIY